MLNAHVQVSFPLKSTKAELDFATRTNTDDRIVVQYAKGTVEELVGVDGAKSVKEDAVAEMRAAQTPVVAVRSLSSSRHHEDVEMIMSSFDRSS